MRTLRTALAPVVAAAVLHSGVVAVPPLRSRVRGAIIGGLVGDALALGFHYEYDARVIAEKGGCEKCVAGDCVACCCLASTPGDCAALRCSFTLLSSRRTRCAQLPRAHG